MFSRPGPAKDLEIRWHDSYAGVTPLEVQVGNAHGVHRPAKCFASITLIPDLVLDQSGNPTCGCRATFMELSDVQDRLLEGVFSGVVGAYRNNSFRRTADNPGVRDPVRAGPNGQMRHRTNCDLSSLVGGMLGIAVSVGGHIYWVTDHVVGLEGGYNSKPPL